MADRRVEPPSGVEVRVNGGVVSQSLRRQTDRTLVLGGSESELGVQVGHNEVTVTVGGHTSAVYSFYFSR